MKPEYSCIFFFMDDLIVLLKVLDLLHDLFENFGAVLWRIAVFYKEDLDLQLQLIADVLIIPANVIAALKEKNLHVRCFLYELATKRFSDVMWAMQQIMFKGLDQRLAEFLFAEAERTGSNTIRMTHEQIAQHISSAREAVARMLKSFSEDGLVELKRGAITLRDKNRLNRLK